jgi:pimeloyl-ACP methyl ester carboxylesterase
MLAAFASCLPGSASAQENSRHEVLRTQDGFPIHITYYPFTETKDNMAVGAQNTPVVVLLHGQKESRLLWDKSSAPQGQPPLPQILQSRGYAVISVDLRKHGESVIEGRDEPIHNNDYQAMVLGDLAAVKQFIYNEHQAKKLNMAKLAIVGVGAAAPVACAFAEYDWNQTPFDDAPTGADRTPRGQDVKVLILISPEGAVGRLKASTSLAALRNPAYGISLQVIVGADDTLDKKQADSVFQAFAVANKEGDRVEMVTPKTKDRGLSVIRQPVAYAAVVKFLDARLKSLTIPWQDRRSRLER